MCIFAAMKRALEQVDLSSDESSSSNADDHKAKNGRTSNITVDQVVDELVSESTTIKCDSKQMNDNFNIGQGVEELFSEGQSRRFLFKYNNSVSNMRIEAVKDRTRNLCQLGGKINSNQACISVHIL
ncbi:hypothetical protein BC332_06919 [Capsicum chinense]|nr:hypothetical protein BC332_06919 [Capsicum chinense]